MDEFITNVDKPQSARRDDLPEQFNGLALSGIERSELRERYMNSGAASPAALFSDQNYVNVVEWDPKYSFIAAQFPRMSN